MWKRTENGEAVKPDPVIISGDRVILNRNFKKIEATEEMPEHYEYETWDMTQEQYEVYQTFESQINDTQDALIELAEILIGE